MNVRIRYVCKKCYEDVHFFGRKIGRVYFQENARVYPSELYLLPRTNVSEGKEITLYLNSYIIDKNWFEISVFNKTLRIPYFFFPIGEKRMKGSIVVEIEDFPTKLSLENRVNIVRTGIHPFIFCCFMIGIVGLIIYFEYRKY